MKSKVVLECLKRLRLFDTDNSVLESFSKNRSITVFDNYSGHLIDKSSPLGLKIAQFERENQCMVYAVTHEYTPFGELYDFLYVSGIPANWNREINLPSDVDTFLFQTYAYVWNKTHSAFSTIAFIGIHTFGGGLCRIA